MIIIRRNVTNLLRQHKSLALGLLLAVPLTLSVPNFGHAQTSLSDSIVAAESTQDPETRITRLQSVLARLNAGEIAPSVTVSQTYVRAVIVAAYADAYQKSQDVKHIEAVQKFIRTSYKDDHENQAWAYLETLNRLATSRVVLARSDIQDSMNDLLDAFESSAAQTDDRSRRDRLYYGLLTVLLRADDERAFFAPSYVTLAHSFIKKMDDPTARRNAMRLFAKKADAYPEGFEPLYKALKEKPKDTDPLIRVHENAVKDDQFELAILALQAIYDKDERRGAMFSFFEKNFEDGNLSRASRVADAIENPAKKVDAWSLLGGQYLIDGYDLQSKEAYEFAQAAAQQIDTEDSQKKALDLISERKKRDAQKADEKKNKKSAISEKDRKTAQNAQKAFAEGGIEPTVDVIKQIKDPIFRAQVFRIFAQAQTKLNDKYGLLNSQPKEDGLYVLNDFIGDHTLAMSVEDIESFESDISNKQTEDPDHIVVIEGQENAIGARISQDPLVDRLKVTGNDLRRSVPLSQDGEVVRAYYENNIYANKFYSVFGNVGFTDVQNTITPEMLVIKNGMFDIPALYDRLRENGLGDAYMSRDGRVYTLNKPLIVQPGAVLIITGQDVEDFRMSTQKGAFLIVSGDLYIQDTKITAWNDDQNEPMWVTYQDKREFRPFITGWSKSRQYIGNSEIIALGYANGKSYGVSMSAGPSNWYKFGNDPKKDRPTGIMADNSLLNVYYGYYSYEADDVVLVGNEYIDNIVYGIDPHDRSNRFAIGYNTAYDTQKKHGIIISREVNDSLFFGNLSFDNAGTGFMLDRDSNNSFVYGNTGFRNKQEGMTVFESDCSIIAANLFFNNKGAGFRLRNSYNIGLFYNDVINNGSAGITAYSARLFGDPVHAHRDFGLDPYDELTTVTAVGNRIESNGMGLHIDMNLAGLFMKGNQFVDQSPRIFRGTLFDEHPGLLFKFDQNNQGIAMGKTCPALVDPLYVQSCKHRENNILNGDGMDQLIDRIEKSSCAKSITDQNRSTYYSEGKG